MKTAISTKGQLVGQLVLPVAIRKQDGIEPGQEFEIERLDRGEYRLTRLSSRANEGVVDWLLACPGKGFFTPIESESTDNL
jgi:bifunctional DNA-binding transcriptional regulator/antitoxin component of YhaV-PrlF toxin-antitoxin module